MKISKFTKVVVAICAFFLGAIPAFLLFEKTSPSRGMEYPDANNSPLFDNWDRIPAVLGITLLSGVVFVILSVIILNQLSKRK